MSVLVTADLHLSANSRDAYRWVAMEFIAGLIEKHKIKTLLILGDLTEEKDYHGAQLVNDVVELLFNLSCMCPVIVLRGNHDYKDAACPYFFFARRLENVRWVNVVTKLDFGIGSCLFLPHTQNYQRDWEGGLPKGEWEWIFAHNTFEGATTEHGHKLHGIPLSVFPKGAAVLSGDIHTPQTIGPVTYVGSPYTVDFGDKFLPRVLLLEANGVVHSIDVLGPQKRLLTLDEFTFKRWDGKYLYKDDIVKIRYKLAADEREKWPEIKKQIRTKIEALGCIPFLIQPVLDTTSKKTIVSSRRDIKSDEQTVRDFSKQAKVSEQVLETGLELVREA